MQIDDLHVREPLPEVARLQLQPGAYAAANQAIIDEAVRSAHETNPPAQILAVLAWEGASRGGDDSTDNFRRIALEHGFAR